MICFLYSASLYLFVYARNGERNGDILHLFAAKRLAREKLENKGCICKTLSRDAEENLNGRKPTLAKGPCNLKMLDTMSLKCFRNAFHSDCAYEKVRSDAAGQKIRMFLKNM